MQLQQEVNSAYTELANVECTDSTVSMAYQVLGRQIPEVEAIELIEQTDRDAFPNRELTAFDRLKNLVWIKENTLYREALEDWERQTKSVGERLDRREKRSEELTNQIYNVVGFFSVFQGVILTAVTQLTQSTTQSAAPSGCNCPGRPLCGKVWFPIVLSTLAAFAAVVGIGFKFGAIRGVERLMHEERLEQRDTIRREKDLRQKGEHFYFKDLEDRKKTSLSSYWLLWAAVVIVAVLAFTVFLILSYFVILCDKWVIPGWD